MGSIWLENQNRTMLLIFCAWALVAILFLSGSLIRPDRNAIIALVWLLILPTSYRVLAETETMTTAGLIQLPGIPVGSEWQPKTPRLKTIKPQSRRETASRELRRVLKKLGYSSDSLSKSDSDMLVQSPHGRNLVVKVLEGEAGVLACQDAMKAMLDNDAREAIVLAPQGSTSTARRFVRKIRSRRGLHIHIFNDTRSVQFSTDDGGPKPGKN
jgi:hypothetical protein